MDEERSTSTTFEGRATNIVTSSGTLVSPLFGFIALAKGSGSLKLSQISALTLMAALAFFVLAVVSALA